MYAILPQTEGFIWDDADYFTSEECANDSAFDWSADLHGVAVNIYEETEKGFNLIRQVWA